MPNLKRQQFAASEVNIRRNLPSIAGIMEDPNLIKLVEEIHKQPKEGPNTQQRARESAQRIAIIVGKQVISKSNVGNVLPTKNGTPNQTATMETIETKVGETEEKNPQ